jgi:2-methylaconitate cis-trans-isomerase PrpF
MPSELPDQVGIRCVLLRGGTSKGLYFHDADLPPPGAARDHVLLRLMGSPDALQIDGLGGSRLITSKVAIIKRSVHPDADVDYTFAQIDPARALVAYDANCGNISAGVGPFAVDERLVEVREPVTVVRILNTNTGKVLVAHVPVCGGKAAVRGDTRIPGVPGTGAEVFMDFTGSIGAKTGRLLPTGRVLDSIEMSGRGRVDVTLCDAGNPVVFVAAADIGLTAREQPSKVDGDEEAIRTLRELRGKAAQLLGFCGDWRKVDEESANLPVVMFVAPPADYDTSNGEAVAASSFDVCARFVFFNRCHESMAGTGSICIGAASRIPGSVVHRAVGAHAAAAQTLRIGHPMGVMTVQVRATAGARPGEVTYERIGFSRTARRIMAGEACVPRWDLR